MSLEDTNVKSFQCGRGAAKGAAEKLTLGRFIVCTMPVPWSLARETVGGAPLAVVTVETTEERELERQLESLPQCQAFLGVGGGQAVDVAKYFSWRRGCRLVTVPTVVSVDAFVTPSAAVRRGSEVVYVGQTSPDPLVIDFDLITTAPRDLNVAGVGDILSIHTATYDWELAHKAGKSEYPFSPDDIQKARSILDEVMSKTTDIATVSDTGIESLVKAYMSVNTICLPAGHYRVEEGSEHYLFYALEKRLWKTFIHRHIVGLGVYIMSRLQNNEHGKVVELMESVGLKYHPKDMGWGGRRRVRLCWDWGSL